MNSPHNDPDPVITSPDSQPDAQAGDRHQSAPPPVPAATRRSWRGLESGRGRRVLAMIAGPVLLVGLLPLIWSGPAGPEELRRAERALARGGALGNNDAATAAAGSLGDTMANLRRNFFTGGDAAGAAESFPTHVWLSEDGERAAVLVQIPEWSHFDHDARDSLAEMTWMSAVLVLQQQDQRPERLTVAVRGGWGFDRGLDGRPVEGEVADEVEHRTRGSRATRRLLGEVFAGPGGG